MANKNNPHKWTEEHDEFIRNNFHTLSKPKIAESLGVSHSAVRHRTVQLGLRHSSTHPFALIKTDKQKEFIRRHYSRMTNKAIAEKLGVSWDAVAWHAKKLGLKRFSSRKWTEKDNQFLKDNFPTKHATWCANELGRSMGAVCKKAEELGLKRLWAGEYIDACGYRVKTTGKRTRKLEHRIVMEEKLGRKLSSHEVVHHIDEDKTNNHPDNLEVMTRAEHINHHRHALIAAQCKI